MILTREHLAVIMPLAGERIDTYLEPLHTAMLEADIRSAKRIAMWTCQLAHESGELRYTEELASGEAYEHRRDLGNISPGDGRRYKGRGLIQVTGRANYQTCSRYLSGSDILLLEHPELLATDPLLACRSAAWYWITRGINRFADRRDVISATRRINGGSNGLSDRLHYYQRACAVLGVE